MFFVLFFLLLLDNGRSKDHIQVGNNFSEEVELCEDRHEDEEVYRSVDEHGGDGQGDLEEEEGSGSREVNSIGGLVLPLMCHLWYIPYPIRVVFSCLFTKQGSF